MIVKRKEETIKMNNGTHLHVFTEVVPKEELMQEMEIAEKAYKNNPCLINKLDYFYAKGDYLFGKGDAKDAIEYLEDELDMIHDLDNDPETLLKWLDVNSLMAEMLIREKKLDKAMKYADVVIECAENHFPGTVEYIYAEELYATVLALSNETKIAKRWYNDALDRIKREMADMETLRMNIERTLAELNED